MQFLKRKQRMPSTSFRPIKTKEIPINSLHLSLHAFFLKDLNYLMEKLKTNNEKLNSYISSSSNLDILPLYMIELYDFK